MAQILCSTGTMIGRPNGRDYRLLSKYVKELHCDGYEFMMYSTWYDRVPELIAYLKELRMFIPIVHCEKSVGELISVGGEDNFREAYLRFEVNCKLSVDLNAEMLVLHLWGGMPSDQKFEHNIQAYPVLKGISEKYNLELLVENVVCNKMDPFSRMEELRIKYPDIHFVFDTKMAAFHSQLERLYEPETEVFWRNGHIKHYHVNDYAGGHMDWSNLRTLPIGKGQIDFKRFFEYIQHINYDDTFTVEATAFNQEGVVDIDMLNDQFSQIREFLHK